MPSFIKVSQTIAEIWRFNGRLKSGKASSVSYPSAAGRRHAAASVAAAGGGDARSPASVSAVRSRPTCSAADSADEGASRSIAPRPRRAHFSARNSAASATPAGGARRSAGAGSARTDRASLRPRSDPAPPAPSPTPAPVSVARAPRPPRSPAAADPAMTPVVGGFHVLQPAARSPCRTRASTARDATCPPMSEATALYLRRA